MPVSPREAVLGRGTLSLRDNNVPSRLEVCPRRSALFSFQPLPPTVLAPPDFWAPAVATLHTSHQPATALLLASRALTRSSEFLPKHTERLHLASQRIPYRRVVRRRELKKQVAAHSCLVAHSHHRRPVHSLAAAQSSQTPPTTTTTTITTTCTRAA